MVQTYYSIMLLLSVLMTLLYAHMWQKHFDCHITLIFAYVPIHNLGYWLICRSKTLEGAITANKIVYIGGCYLILFIMLSIFSLCHVKLKRGFGAVLLFINTIVYTLVLTIGDKTWYYKNARLDVVNNAAFLYKEYGSAHLLYYALVIAYFTATIAVLLHSYFKKKYVSKSVAGLLCLSEILSVIAFFGGRRIFSRLEMLPLSNVLSQIVFLLVIRRMCLYDITDSGIDSLIETGETGFISFDLKYNYLGSNTTARRILPQLTELTVDHPIDNEELKEIILPRITRFREDDLNDKSYYETNDRIYLIDVNHLYDGRRKCGYQLFLTDDTENQKYIALMNSYNSDLKAEVARKTERIVAMHDNLILSLAVMVEGRDNSTGGHIRRTSDVMRILVDEIKRTGSLDLSEDFCKNIVKAAPMHDLGKIAVDDAILRKPGRFTPDEYEKMKSHAAEGARIVHTILENTDDEYFKEIAENVAHFHHERWDGSGYPERLKGEAIPLEARIMSIADVYDALVSKRVYKDAMSFEQANAIMTEGMGTQFDPALEKIYTAALPRLEKYYSSAE